MELESKQPRIDEMTDLVASVLLDHVLWHHLPQENHDGE